MTPFRRFTLCAATALLAAIPPAARGDICISNMWDNGAAKTGPVYPNWQMVRGASYDVLLCSGCAWQPTARLTGLTVVNFGSAPAADVKAVYWLATCGATTSGLQTMTFRGNYAENGGTYPAWTWSGSSADFSACPVMWVGGPGYFTLSVYFDVSECPTPQATVSLGFPISPMSGTLWSGSIRDNAGCFQPWYNSPGPSMTILYTFKESDVDVAAPGDTVMYDIYYGRPGTTDLSGVEIVDTQPPYTHYVPGSGVPAPDAGWDPDFGPPVRLKWTIPGPLPVAGGTTDLVSFALSVDWGNGEGFEPGSGDVAAPEGERLNNLAQVFFRGITGCSRATIVNPPVTTTVRRFLFWKLGDNDLLYAPTLGQPPDEMVYSIYLKNTSPTKTWWRVGIWDTVPAELDIWKQGFGFDDPCLGWTMTPSGCAGASPGRITAGGFTLLTWKLDMPPSMTLSLRWKAAVRPNASAGQTVINRASILSSGWTGVVEGTGGSTFPRNFTHIAPIILPTTFISYVGFAASDARSCGKSCPCPGFFIDFFPLNRKTQFELRALQYEGGAWPSNGGVSASIGTLIGDCVNGFPGAGGIPGGGIAGCKAERIPAQYDPAAWHGVCPTYPFNFVYKITGNSPVLWQLITYVNLDVEDRLTYAPSTTLNYSGLMHYLWKIDAVTQQRGYGDSLSLINTDPYRRTTVHLFRYDYANLAWTYQRTYELEKGSQAFDMTTLNADQGPWRTVSSDASLIVGQAMNMPTALACYPFCGRSYATLAPTSQTGNVVSDVGSGTFYFLLPANQCRVVVGNTGAATASYRIWRYIPDNTLSKAPMPTQLNGTGGTWVQIDTNTVPAGLASPGNARLYMSLGDPPSLSLYKLDLLSGGPLQVLGGGGGAYSIASSGSVVHAADGFQTGTEFWLFHIGGNWDPLCDNGASPGYTNTQTFNIYCPKTGMAVRAVSEDGYSSTYTTTGPDQCVSFTTFTNLPDGGKRNYRFNILPGPAFTNAMAQYIQCNYTEKGWTAPFLQTGVHYRIIAPPVVYLGQSFWITVVVVEVGGATNTTYAGTTSFTSTDPGAKIESASMDSYNYTWTGGDAGVNVFINVSLSALGLQNLVAGDTEDGSITGLATILVVAADVKLAKEPMLSILSSGETVQFRVCWSNYSTATAAAFTITDAVPMGTSYVPEAASLMFCGAGGPAAPAVTVAYGTASATTPGTFNTLTSPTQTAPASTRWLRWTIQDVYVYSTGCVCFRTKVD